jgi:hypothetical protein
MLAFTTMDVTKIIAELRQEQEQIDHAIMALQLMGRGQGKRRGRPPKWLSEQTAEAPKRRGRPAGSKNRPKVETEG